MEFTSTQVNRAFRKAAVNAINKTLISCRAAAIKHIRDSSTVRAEDLRDRITILRAHRDKLEGYLVVRGEGKNRIPLGRFRATQNRTGVRVVVSRAQPTLIPHAFIPQLPSGHRSVFIRKGPKRKMKHGRWVDSAIKRQPIIEMAGPTPAVLYRRSNAADVVKATAQKIGSVLQHEMKFALGRVKR